MIRPGFLSAAERGALIAVARDGLVEHRVARRANAIVLLNDGWNCEEVGSALLLDDDTVREWFEVYQRQGMAGLRNFGHEGSSCQLTDEQQTALKAFVTTRLPRSTNAIGTWLRKNYELSYSHSGLIALLHRLDFVYHKPQRVPRKLDEAQQQAFIASYEKLLNRLEPDESVVFVDAVHPTHQARPTGCWAPKDVAIGIEQTTGRQLEAAILSRMRSEVTSRSNWANDSSTFSVSRPIEVVVLNCWVTDTKDTSWRSNNSTSLAKSASGRVRRSTLLTTMTSTPPGRPTPKNRGSAGP